MTSVESAPPQQAAPAAPGGPSRPSPWSPRGILLGVYRLFHNNKFGLALILLLAVMALAGVIFPQVTAEFRADPEAYEAWLEERRASYGGWTTVLSLVGAFSMFSSVPFAAVTILLVLSIVACTVHRMPQLWRNATAPRRQVGEGFFEHARLRDTVEVTLAPEQATERARALLEDMRFRVLDGEGPGTNLVADRHRFAPFGTVLAHLALVVILLGVLITGSTGFREDQFTVAVGSSREVGHDTGLTVEVLSFADTYHADGRPADYVSEIVLYDEGEQVARKEVRVNTPLRYDGVKINQANFGVAADMLVTGPDGAVLYEQGLPLERSTQDGRLVYNSFRLEEPDLLVYVVSPASGQVDEQIGAGQVLVEVYPGDADVPTAREVVTQGEPYEIEGLTVTFEREQKYTGLMVSRDDGAVWVYAGAALLVLGSYLTMVLRHHRVWVRVHPQGAHSVVRVGSHDRIDLRFQPRFEAMVRRLAEPPSSPAAKG